MNDEKWYELIENIREKFGIGKEETEPMVDGSTGDKIGEKEIIEFSGATGKMRLERTKKKVVLDKILHYHKRRDGAVAEYKYSPDEYSTHLDAFRWDETLNSWEKIENPASF